MSTSAAADSPGSAADTPSEVILGSLELAGSPSLALARHIIRTVDPGLDEDATIRSLLRSRQFSLSGPLRTGTLVSAKRESRRGGELEASDPDLACAVHGAIAEFEVGSDDVRRVPRAVEHAVRAGRFDLVAAAFTRYGESVEDLAPGLWDRALEHVPAATVQQHPALEHLVAVTAGPRDPWSTKRRIARAGLRALEFMAETTPPAERALGTADATIAYRLAGRTDEAVRLGDKELARLEARSGAVETSLWLPLSRLAFETATSALFAGEIGHARARFEYSYDHIGGPEGAGLGLASAGSLAMIAAAQEHGTLADHWIDRAQAFRPEVRAGADDRETPLKLALALRAASTLGVAAGRQEVTELLSRDRGPEYWPYLLLADARITVLEGKAAQGIVRHTTVLHAAGQNLPRPSAMGTVAHDALSWLSLANGQVSAARNTIERGGDEITAEGELLLAVASLHDGDHEGARVRALRLTKHPSLSIVARACMLASSAYLNAGQSESATEAFTWGHLSARELDTVQPYLWIPADERHELARATGLASELEELLPGDPNGLFEYVDHNLRFTYREFQVLTLLAEGLKRREIAQRLFITEDTAKSHLARVYKKLGVGTQAAALARARELDILGHAGPELRQAPRTREAR